MAYNSRTDVWLGLAIAAITIIAIKAYKSEPSANSLASIETAAGAESLITTYEETVPAKTLPALNTDSQNTEEESLIEPEEKTSSTP